MKIVCPICEIRCGSKIGFFSHFSFKHVRGYALTISFVLFVLGVIVSVLITANDQNVNFFWDKYVLGQETDFFVSLNSIFVIGGGGEIIIDDSNKVDYLNRFVEVGIIPPWHNNKEPLKLKIKDPHSNVTHCMYLANKNGRPVKAKDITPEMKESAQSWWEVLTTVPSPYDYPLQDCPSCLAVQIYAGNRGNRTIELADLQICFHNENEIIDTSNLLYRENKNCVRLKESNLISEEVILGYIILKDSDDKVCYPIWSDIISTAKGKFISKDKEFDINKEDITELASGVITNCSFK